MSASRSRRPAGAPASSSRPRWASFRKSSYRRDWSRASPAPAPGLQHLGKLAEGLLGWVADQQPADHPAGHAEQALPLEAERDLLDVVQLGLGGATAASGYLPLFHPFSM